MSKGNDAGTIIAVAALGVGAFALWQRYQTQQAATMAYSGATAAAEAARARTPTWTSTTGTNPLNYILSGLSGFLGNVSRTPAAPAGAQQSTGAYSGVRPPASPPKITQMPTAAPAYWLPDSPSLYLPNYADPSRWWMYDAATVPQLDAYDPHALDKYRT